ncbi:radical SAM protein [Candidatus Woesearchaeota archaeon]|nr:radical SAM protein [Candidatus Woesearchaeota archaeon]
MIRQFDVDTWYDSSNDQFIFSNRISLSGKPITLTVEVSDACNLECPYCLSESEIKKAEKLPDSLVDRLKELAPFKLVLGGGEPFILPNITNLLKTMKDADCSLYVATNGVHIPDESLSYVDCLDIHIDGTNKETYYRSMGKNRFKQVMNNIEKSISAGIQVRLNCIVNKNNYDNISTFPDFCRDNGITHLQLIRLLPMGRAKKANLFVSERDITKLREEMNKHSDLSIHFMYADFNKTKEKWFRTYPVFDGKGNLIILPEHEASQETIFDRTINEVFNQYKQFLYNSPRSIIKDH